MGSCLACDLSNGSVPLPGGQIHASRYWRVEHCIGPLGVGTLLVKPKRHVLHVADLTGGEANELGPLLQRTAAVVSSLCSPAQVYVTLWSHADALPGHIHWVVQPVTRQLMTEFDGEYGVGLQLAMFQRAAYPDAGAVDAFARRARASFADDSSA
jgi:diadenosine tetraphosphate (Ap4A) HIT family hydrolase